MSSLLVLDRVAEIELVRADHVALRADPEQLAFDRVAVESRVERLAENLVERLLEPLARAMAIDRRVFRAVGNPDVRDRGRAELPPEMLADRAADDAVADPELPNAFVAAGEREPVGGQRMGEERAVEIQPDLPPLGPIDPASEMLRRKLDRARRPGLPSPHKSRANSRDGGRA